MDENKNVVVDETTKTDNPTVKEDSSTDGTRKESVKSFTQDELDKIVIERVGKTKSSIFKKLGIEKDEDIQSLLDKASKHDELAKRIEELSTENEGYKKADLERGYKTSMKNVDGEFVDFIYEKLPPQEKETKEDYAKRVDEYLNEHPKFKKVSSNVVGEVRTNVDLNGQHKDQADNQLRSYFGLKPIK